jgi:hypothetical protein
MAAFLFHAIGFARGRSDDGIIARWMTFIAAN